MRAEPDSDERLLARDLLLQVFRNEVDAKTAELYGRLIEGVVHDPALSARIVLAMGGITRAAMHDAGVPDALAIRSIVRGHEELEDYRPIYEAGLGGEQTT